jgi:hypothetical protein
MLHGPAKAHSRAIPLIDRAQINPPDPIAFRAASARSEGQGRRPVLRMANLRSTAFRLQNAGRRCSLAFDRSEHDGRLMACRDGGSCAISQAITAMIIVGILHSALPMVALAETSTTAPSNPVPAHQSGDLFAAHIAEASQRFGIPEHSIAAVLRAESAGDPRAVSRAGAMGLMQIMPDTWAELRVRHRLGSDPFDTRDNIHAGAAYLREMLDRYGNVGAMLASYNAGPGRYDEYLASGRILPAETRAYVAALAPILGAESLPFSSVSAPFAPPDWRAAPLFVQPVGRGFDASPAPGAAPSEDGAGAHPADGSDPLSVEASSLFAGRSGAGGPP